MNTLGRAWGVVYENGRSSGSAETRREVEEFATDAEARLTRIQRQLNRDAFDFRPARGVPIPKKGNKGIRPLVIAPIESRIVQRAIHDVLLAVPEIRRFAESPYSFGGVKRRAGDSVAAVPAAIQAVLAAIASGATYAIRSDITSFFTKIPKPLVTAIVEGATGEPDFVALFSQAITLELDNLASLREHASAFPIYEIGVAQGSSLSPLLGNILLHEFDQEMNVGACRCVRYVDDFLILAPDRSAAELRFARGLELLEKHGLEASREKTSRGSVAGGFEFLAIELGNGLISPSRASRKRLLAAVSSEFAGSARAFRMSRGTDAIPRSLSLIRTLHTVSGIIQGWGNQYFFCNEKIVFKQLDEELDALLRRYLGTYAAAMKAANQTERRRLIGVPLLEEFACRPFVWPKPLPKPHAPTAAAGFPPP